MKNLKKSKDFRNVSSIVISFRTNKTTIVEVGEEKVTVTVTDHEKKKKKKKNS